ncbi:DUF1761 domain-containing protein [Parasphingopyxis lamellibrachiae]|uniref:Uncharacterized protein DUF1761 n=1 Tax=Parasphingopyxis lamellibrachiae TaxID=680125 RepID=A0A3D9FDH3_9SPHN|nr:DUF1761 domain-containing protein [Parasphingopyxis lamellibrachiae]RED15875.1 uncharacterized protein DUF1761 [Parasphingopyxis lamellibrachiae]
MEFYAENWIAIIAAAAAGFVVGGIWYGPVMGKKWMGAVGLTEEDIQSGNMGMIYGTTFVLSLVASTTLAHVLTYFPAADLGTILMVSVGIALGFLVPAIGTNYLFSQKSRTLFLIDATYWLLFYAAMGVVHALL